MQPGHFSARIAQLSKHLVLFLSELLSELFHSHSFDFQLPLEVLIFRLGCFDFELPEP